MRLFFLLLMVVSQTLLAGWCATNSFQKALPGYQFRFPQDHGNHAGFKTEWWYTTGHLNTVKTAQQPSQPYGFELTFFRSATGIDQSSGKNPTKTLPKPWQLPQVYPAHFAITDILNKRFFYTQRMSRPNTAGADQTRVWNEHWQLSPLNGKQWQLTASHPPYGLNLRLTPLKTPVIHGLKGVSQKADCLGCASHYYSMTRLAATGTITVDKTTQPVNGLVWMDHEFGSNQLTANQVGWDWFSIQLNDNTDWMFYQMRLKNGKTDPNSSGTAVLGSKTTHLTQSELRIVPLKTWLSPHWTAKLGNNKPAYPAQWRVTVPSQQLDITVTPIMADQELAFANQLAYWEGACLVTGVRAGKPVTGQAYVELTGYAQAFSQQI